jgi:2',3'-cyclic-nucleotide 2'-phosphodiesterase (5'-nucleotidase family)
MIRQRRRVFAAIVATAIAAAGLTATTNAPVAAAPPEFRLQVLHASDLEGGVAAIERAPNFAAIVDAVEDAPGVDGSILVSAGDNIIPGPFFSASGDSSVQPTLNSVYNQLYQPAALYNDLRAAGGRIDISIMNVLGFDASALGNHEWDLGSTVLADIINDDLRGAAGPPGDRWVGAQFPYLSANLDFTADPFIGPLATTSLLPTSAFVSAPNGPSTAPKVAPFAIIEEAGEQIGVVGATTPLLRSISSPTGTVPVGPTINDMPALAAVLQPAIDTVVNSGVDKVVLVSHLQQFSLEQQLVGLLDGVDIVIAGGSDTILANADDLLRPGDVAEVPYPFIATTEAGEPAVVVSTDGEYSYVGRLVVDFDADGILVAPDGSPLDSITDLDLAFNGPIATTAEQVAAVWGPGAPFAAGTKGALVTELVNAARSVVSAKDGNVFGETDVFIDGRRSEVRTEETTLGNLSADANLALAQQFDPAVVVSIKNGGGIRAEIGEVRNQGDDTLFLPPQANPVSGKLEGQISQLDIENSLRFNNSLTVLTTTAAGLLALVEHGVAATAPGATPGQFPQVGGMQFSFDPTQPAGNRVQSLVIGDGTDADVVAIDGEVVGNPSRPIRLVTLGFLADGGDSYPFAANTVPGSRVNLNTALSAPGAATFAAPGTEQDAFAEFLVEQHGIGDGTPFGVADTPASQDLRIQNLAVRGDAIAAGVIVGTAGSDNLRGGNQGAVLLGLGGNDVLRGGARGDILIGGPGNDTLFGGGGSNRFPNRFVVGEGDDVVRDFKIRRDIIDFQGAFASADAARAAATQVRRGVLITTPSGDTVLIRDLSIRNLRAVTIWP